MHIRELDSYTKEDTLKYLFGFFLKSIIISLCIIICIIFIVSAVVLGDIAYNAKKGNNVVPLIAGYVIITPSMVPTINVNDAVLVKRTEDNKLNIGDIITFKTIDDRYDGITITHRIVGTQKLSSGENVFRTKGDNNRLEDSAVVLSENIFGKVIFKLPFVGYIKNILNSKIGYALLVFFPLLSIIVVNIKNIFKENEEMD